MKNKNDRNEIKFLKLFSFSDGLDKFLIFIGVFNAVIAAILQPIIFFLYGRVAKIFVDYQNANQPKSSDLLINSSSLENITSVYSCLKPTNQIIDLNFDERMGSTINFYILVSAIGLLVNYMANVCLNTAAERQIKRIRNKFFETIVRQDMEFFDKNTPGELSSILISNLENVKTSISYKCSEFISYFGRGLACIAFALITAPKFSVVFLGIVPLVIISINVMVRMIKKYTVLEFEAYASAGQIAQETLSSIRTIFAFGIQKKVITKYGLNLKSAESLAVKKGFFKGLFEGISSFLFNSYFGIAIILASYLERNDCTNYNAGNLMAAFFCLVTSTSSIGQAGPYLGDVAQSKGAAKKLFEILETKSKIDIFDKSSDKKINKLNGNIQFEDVSFSYPQRLENRILNRFSLKIPAGKTVAFCGSSGCGKSTTFSLLQRFYLPSSGHIKFDDVNIEDLDLEWLRNQMALVSQEPILFQTTIRENIRLGRLDATDEEIKDAARQANAHDFIMETANKYETLVGERGTQLSGGQKQRIAIARALLRNPRILLLDEATSALDNQSEKIVQEALDKAKIGRTTLIIAHRLSTIRNADLIVGIENGQVKEVGTHDQLMELKGLYHSLVVSQTNMITKEKGKKETSVSEQSETEDDEEEEVKKKFIQQTSFKMSLEEKPSIKKEKEYKKRNNLFRYELKLWKIQRPDLIWIMLGVLSQMIVGAVFPLVALVFSQIYSIFSITDYDERFNQSLKLMSAIISLALANFVFSFLLNYALALCGARLTKNIRVLMFESLLKQEIAFYDCDQNRSSVLSAQLSHNAPLCKGLTSDKLGLLCQGFSGIGLAVIVSFALNWKLAMVMCIFVPVAFGAGVVVGQSSTNIKVKGKTLIEEGGRLLTETVENIKTVSSLSREKYFLKEFKAIYDMKFKKTLALFHLQAFFYSISNTLIFFVQITAFSFGYYLVKTENLKVSHLYTVYAAMTFSSLILGRVYAQLPDQVKARQSAKTAFKIIDRKSKIDSMSQLGLKPSKFLGNIEFKNVCFEYSSRPGIKILNNFNLSVQNGQTNALVGPSGCGKSTTISLLLRFYDVTEGAILFDGVDIRKLNIQWLRSQIGIVSQEPVLFNYSIKENIENGETCRDMIPIEEIVEVAVQSNIHDRIESFPEKYDTLVGNRGGQLSGGEKQRIAIARALIRKPKILLLDEATSALDNQSELVVQEALGKAQLGRTCIVIAHRLSTIQDAHKISVVKNGSVVEEGSHSELMNIGRVYFNLHSNHNSFTLDNHI